MWGIRLKVIGLVNCSDLAGSLTKLPLVEVNSSSMPSRPRSETAWKVVTTARRTPKRSCRGLRTTASWIVVQCGLAAMPRRAWRASESGFTSGTTRATSGSRLNWPLASITWQPAAAARGAWAAAIAGVAAMKARSHCAKSKRSTAATLRLRSPKLTWAPTARPEASAVTWEAGNSRSARARRISRPTAPTAPMTATR